MVHTPFAWANDAVGGTPITAERLNAIEAGIAAAQKQSAAERVLWREGMPQKMVGPAATSALIVPTHVSPAGGELTHPSIVFIPEGLSGYRYWLAMTPYPGGNDAAEDPNIVASNDGETWTVPAGLTNPLDDAPGSPTSLNSDVCLVYGSDGRLHLWWRRYTAGATGAEEVIKYRSSHDGVTWTATQDVISNSAAVRRLLAPTVVEENGRWVMWAVDMVPSPNKIVRLTATAPEGPWSAPTNGTIDAITSGQEPWHPEVRVLGGIYVMLLNTIDLNSDTTGGQLIFATSRDGVAWTGMTESIIPRVNGTLHDYLYKASFLPAVGPDGRVGFSIWYSARRATPEVWNLFHTFVAAPIAAAGSGPEFGVVSGSASDYYALSAARAHEVTMTGDTTFSLPAPAAGLEFLLLLSGAFTPSFPASVAWAGGTAPTYASKSLYRFTTVTAGNIWVGELVASGLTPTAPTTLASAVLALSPVGYWKLNETTGTQAADSSGNLRHGTYSGAYVLAGRNGFVTLNGGYVNIPDDNAWTISASGLTVFAIVYVNASTSRQFIASKGAAGDQFEWGLEVGPAAPFPLSATWWTNTGKVWQSESTSGAYPAAGWHAVAFTITDPAAKGSRFPLYMDSGVALTTTQTTPTNVDNPANGTAPLRLGNRGDNAGALAGSLAHVAVFAGKLTAAQIGDLVNAARSEGLIP